MRKLAVVLVDDIIEKSILYVNTCIERILSFVKGLGELKTLRFCLDSRIISEVRLSRF